MPPSTRNLPYIDVKLYRCRQYPGQDYAARTIATTTLGIRKDMPEELVYKITKTIFENLDYIYKSYDALKYMSLEHAIPGWWRPCIRVPYAITKSVASRSPRSWLPPSTRDKAARAE
ncbi:MAG: TAXI family TRAP transporter solute-binding subunit [Bacillota bacterium]|nr:TAXI family TRAP transporter solute-binding subunit [Bacillota bacterium]